MGVLLALGAAFATAAGAATAAPHPAGAAPGARVVVTYASEAALRDALALEPARVVRRLPALRAVEVVPAAPAEAFARAVRSVPGIVSAERPRLRRRAAEPALLAAPGSRAPYQWQHAATGHDRVPAWALRAAASVTIAVVDTGADLAAPDLAAKAPAARDVRTGSADVADAHGHGTFVASLAAGSVANGEGIAGAGGDARLLIVKAGASRATLSDVDGAAGIVHAVDAGARILNLSFGGPGSSAVERRAVEYAVARGALLVAAVGNDHERGNAPHYPAALLQPVGSKGVGGAGLAVAASTAAGGRAWFSTTGSHVSLAAPGEEVFAAVSSLSSPRLFPRVPLPGSSAGLYGYGSGTSYAAPQVAGAAALVWGANPQLAAAEVATILKETARGGRWTPSLGWGVVDAAAAVARAAGEPAPAAARLTLSRAGRGGRVVTLRARLGGAAALAERTIRLDRLEAGTWREAAAGTTAADGTVTWRFSLAPGTHRLRARFAGADDLPPATSAPVAVRTR